MINNRIPGLDTPESRFDEECFDPGRKHQLLSSEQYHCDHPSICRASDNCAWAVWVSYCEGNDKIMVCKYDNGHWHTPFRIPDVEGDIYKPSCSAGADGELMVVWPMQNNNCWDIWYCIFDGDSFTNAKKAVNKKFNDFAPQINALNNNGYALVWQGWEKDSFQIMYSEYIEGMWSSPEVLGLDGANNWNPDITVSKDGTVSISWDTYKWGSYDVYVRQKKYGKWEKPVIVAGTPHFEANSSIDSDSKGNVWVAYEERQVNWGKDKSYMTSYIEDEFETLVGFSRVRVCCYTRDGKLMRPFQPRDQQVSMYQWGGDHLPRISIGDDDRVWLMFRRPDIEMKVFRNYQRLIPVAAWKNYTRFFDGEIWSRVISFNDNHSRIDSDLNGIVLSNGNLLGIWHSENRVKGNYFYAAKEPQQDLIYSNVIDSPETFNKEHILTPTLPGISHYQRAGAEKEKEDIEAVRNYTTDYRGDRLKVFRGDLHRHTDVSSDGASDGMILDLYRYAIDAAGLDFVANTDHNQKTGKDIEYVQWRQEKIADLFYIPGRFVTFYGYERTMGYPNGHKNIIHLKRGVPTVKHPVNMKNAENDTEKLYSFLKEQEGICIPHTTGLDEHAPNTWEALHNSCIEPVVEIYQGTRMSSEYSGAPLSGDYVGNLRDSTSKDDIGVVWDAWKKGHKIGVIASSDHQSTHCAYANVYAVEATREALFDAIKQRHTYGSTDNIIVDFHGKDMMQGDIAGSEKAPEFSVNVKGTDKIKEVMLMKNFEKEDICIAPCDHFYLHWKDENPKEGENIYYIRVVQDDGQVAWSSPIWVNVKTN